MRRYLMEGEIVSTHIKATEDTTLAKLSFIDQFKLLLTKFSNNDEAELHAAEKMSAVSLRMRASLKKLFTEATKPIEEGKRTSVTLQVSSKYIPYIDDVIDPIRGMGRYYEFEVRKKDLPVNVEYMFIVRIQRKVS